MVRSRGFYCIALPNVTYANLSELGQRLFDDQILSMFVCVESKGCCVCFVYTKLKLSDSSVNDIFDQCFDTIFSVYKQLFYTTLPLY